MIEDERLTVEISLQFHGKKNHHVPCASLYEINIL